VFLPLLKLDSIPELSFLETNGKKSKTHLLNKGRIAHCISTATPCDAESTGLFRSQAVHDQAVKRISRVQAEEREPDSGFEIRCR